MLGKNVKKNIRGKKKNEQVTPMRRPARLGSKQQRHGQKERKK